MVSYPFYVNMGFVHFYHSEGNGAMGFAEPPLSQIKSIDCLHDGKNLSYSYNYAKRQRMQLSILLGRRWRVI